MDAIEGRDFQIAYRDAVEGIAHDSDVSFRLPASPDRLSMLGYMAACETLYLEALEMLRWQKDAVRPTRVLDAGGSFGAFAAALQSLGVPTVDSLDTGDTVDLVIGLALHERTTPAWTIAIQGGRLLRPNGRLVLVVPSSQYRRHRLAKLARRDPNTPDDGAVELGTPSYSRRRLRTLLWRSGVRPDRVRGRDYSPAGVGGPLRQTVSGIMGVAPRHREVWLALASRDAGA